ncbi:hypothetical protein [Zunongwangia sp. H14]|uniref:hypothetical protein n=1 Tax=Zunongwangia sp. H14 TaxID=3240792 RepID=UPI00356674D5
MSFISLFLNQLLLPLQKKEYEFCFFIGKKSRINNSHVIHAEFCELLPEETGRIKLGHFQEIGEVITAGKEKFEHVEVCKHCCSI